MEKSRDVWIFTFTWWKTDDTDEFCDILFTNYINTIFVSDIFKSLDIFLVLIRRRRVSRQFGRHLCATSVGKIYRISREWREKFSTTFVNTLKVIYFIGVWTEFLIDFPIKYLFSHGHLKRSFEIKIFAVEIARIVVCHIFVTFRDFILTCCDFNTCLPGQFDGQIRDVCF